MKPLIKCTSDGSAKSVFICNRHHCIDCPYNENREYAKEQLDKLKKK